MPKVNPLRRKVPERKTFTRSFTDVAQPGDEITLSLRPLSALEGHAALESMEKFTALYVTGDADWVESRGKDGVPPMDFPAIGDRVEKLNARFCNTVANILAAQSDVTADGGANEEVYNFEEIAAFSFVYPSAWPQMLRFAQEVEKSARAEKKSDLPEAGGQASATPSAGTSDTPT